MLPLIVAHLVAYSLVFAFGLPAASSLLGTNAIGFSGGLLAVIGASLAYEVVVIVGAFVGMALNRLFGINALLQRKAGQAVSMSAIAVLSVAYFMVASHFALFGLSVSLAGAVAVSLVLNAFLIGALEVKRYCIKNYVK